MVIPAAGSASQRVVRVRAGRPAHLAGAQVREEFRDGARVELLVQPQQVAHVRQEQQGAGRGPGVC